MKRNNDNGWLPRVRRVEGAGQCRICGASILWVRTANRRIPFDYRNTLYWTDHRDPCRVIQRQGIDKAQDVLHDVTSVRRLSNRLMAALVRDGRSLYRARRNRAGLRRDESVPHMSASQAWGPTTRRAASHSAPRAVPLVLLLIAVFAFVLVMAP